MTAMHRHLGTTRAPRTRHKVSPHQRSPKILPRRQNTKGRTEPSSPEGLDGHHPSLMIVGPAEGDPNEKVEPACSDRRACTYTAAAGASIRCSAARVSRAPKTGRISQASLQTTREVSQNEEDGTKGTTRKKGPRGRPAADISEGPREGGREKARGREGRLLEICACAIVHHEPTPRGSPACNRRAGSRDVHFLVLRPTYAATQFQPPIARVYEDG